MLLVTFLFNIYRHFIVVTFVNVLKLFSEVFTSMVVKVFLGSMSNRKYKKQSTVTVEIVLPLQTLCVFAV